MEKENYTKSNFNSLGVLQTATHVVLKPLLKNGEYNFFVHEIQDWDTINGETVESKKNEILRNGLSNKNTIYSINEVTPKALTDYHYGWPALDNSFVLVFAIPKNIKIKGTDVNFSTDSDGLGINCAYELVKEHTIPTEFLAMVIQQKHNGNNSYSLEINNKHLSKLTEKEQKSFMGNFEQKLINKCNIVDTDNSEVIKSKVYKTIKCESEKYIASLNS